MSPDQATQALDDGDRFGRVVAVKQAMNALTSQGMSEDGAKAVINNMLHGASDLTDYTGPASAGVAAYWAQRPSPDRLPALGLRQRSS